MENLEALIRTAADGNDRAFADIIRKFQDMAFGYAYSLLGDVHFAEDAAQESFVEAYLNLKKLKQPAAFPGWLRRIVQFRCSRFLERKQLVQAPIKEAIIKASAHPGPYELMEKQDVENAVFNAINSLSQPQREATTLFYINGYSRKEIADFLEISENAVRNRLSASRKELKRRLTMNGIIKETFGSNKPGDDFTRKVIEGVPKVGYYYSEPLDKDRKTHTAFQMTPFPACLCSCLKAMGENYGYNEVPMRVSGMSGDPDGNIRVRIDNLYTLIMAASGAAFRLNWSPGKWDFGNIDLNNSAEKQAAFNHAFKAIGYGVEIIGNPEYPGEKVFSHYENIDYFRKRIIHSLNDGRLVIAMGVVGPPECCIITGFDKSSDACIGWSFFQNSPEFGDPSIEFDPSGYFRQRDWFRNTRCLILIGEKVKKQPEQAIYKEILEWAVAMTRTENVYERKGGLAAFTAWADDLLSDNDFPVNNSRILHDRMLAHDDAMLTVYEGRLNASYFLKQAAEALPELKDDLNNAADCYETVHNLISRGWEITCNGKRSEEYARKLGQPEIRRKLSEIILKARDKDEEAIEIIEKAVKKM